ncbi:MAG: RecX family transcriptional regulator [Erythrobacter sp.]|uniref:regulatory protein RecX n=1 Tax=Erythrobacter sp. TaxID=1042 RepID=UPI002618D3E6|nr:RecX family transcriptional regulator [Erythrobacter sp.]MDJ0979043.1 RecX family transcriptional regulator [Erythrobacter sp.]
MSSLGSETSGRKQSPERARKARKRAPLDESALRDLALAYVARFATTAAKLEGYLARKIRERGVAEDADGRTSELDVTGLVMRLVELGYIDDEAYARGRSRDLTQRGYGKRRVEQALWAAGVEEQTRADNAPGEAAGRRAAMLLAKKRGFGPFARASLDDEADSEAVRKRKEKHIAAMLRAGHVFEHVRFILDAAHADDVEGWVIEAEEEERDDQV